MHEHSEYNEKSVAHKKSKLEIVSSSDGEKEEVKSKISEGRFLLSNNIQSFKYAISSGKKNRAFISYFHLYFVPGKMFKAMTATSPCEDALQFTAEKAVKKMLECM